MKKFFLIFITIFVWRITLPTSIFADEMGINQLKPEIITEIDQKINPYESSCTNISLGLVYNGKVVFTKSYGTGSINTVYEWASVSKSLTALIIMHLTEINKITNINDDIWEYADQYSGKMPEHCDDGLDCTNSHLTIKQTMTHTAGFYHVTDGEPLYTSGKLNLKFRPGTDFYYSTNGYAVLGDVIAGIDGISYVQAVQKYITQVAGTQSLSATSSWIAPGAYVKSNIYDFSLYTAGIINNKFVTADTLNEMLTNQTSGFGRDFGLGFRIENNGTENVAGFHSGSNGIPRSYIYIKPKLKRSVVVFCQVNSSSNSVNFYTPVRDIEAILARGNGILAHCQPLGDIDCNSKVNAFDFGNLAKYWGLSSYPAANLDDSGVVDKEDALIFLGNYGKSN